MNPMILEIVPSPINCPRDNIGGIIKSTKGTRDFFASMQELLNPAQKKTFHKPTKSVQTGPALKKGYKFYIESLKKRLLANGKPLNKISLNSKDLFVLKKFLFQCGFSRESVERFFRGLAGSNPNGEINLSDFFHKLKEFEPSKKKSEKPVVLDISAIPHLESLLRDFGLSPKELDHAFSYARLEDGKLDLKRLVAKLKEISRQINPRDPEKNQLTIDRNVVLQVLRKLEGAEIHMPDKGMGDRISIKELITELEQMTGGPGKGGQLPGDVKASIDQIVEKVAVTADKEGLRLTDKKGKIVEKESPLSVSREKDNINAKNVEKKATPHSHSKEARLLSDSDVPQARPHRLSENETTAINRARHNGVELDTGSKEEGHAIKSETGKMGVPHEIGSSTFSDTVNAAKHQPKIAREIIPAHLINQVGRQISRSILRGERVIKLQLHPPDLGSVKVEMDIRDNVLKLGMIIENSTVRELLLSNAHELRHALVEQGVKLEKLDIQINYNFGQTLTNSKESSKQNQREAKGTRPMSSIGENGSEQPQNMQRIMLRSDRLLDLTA